MPVHPCETFKESLKEKKATWEDFAAKTFCDKALVEQFYSGNTGINTSLATHLESFFRVPARFWLQLQKNYENALVEEEKLKEKHASMDHGPTSFVHGELFDIKWMISNGRRKWKRRLVREIIGEYLSEDMCDEVLFHVMKHKWYEGERGKVFAANTSDEQIVLAGQDWVSAGYYEKYLGL